MPVDAASLRERWRRLRRALDAAGIGALLVSDRLNFAYLTGHLSREFDKRFRQLLFCLDRDGTAHAFVPSGEAAPLAAREVAVTVSVKDGFDLEEAAAFLHRAVGSPGRLGLEGSGADRPCLTGAALATLLARLTGSEVADASPVLARSRLIKSSEEIDALRAAGDLSTTAWKRFVEAIRPQATLSECAATLAAGFAREGADYNFPGHIELRNATRPGADAVLEGEVLWADFGVTVDGYHADISRRVVLGAPNAAQAAHHAAGAALLEAFIAGLRSGRRIGDAVAAMLAARAGSHRADDPPRRFGHGVGLSAAEPPSLAAWENARLEDGMVLTPEPSFTAADGEFVHLEEMVAIGADGPVRLTLGAETLWRAG